MPGSDKLDLRSNAPSVRVWDIAIRVFHWALVALIVVSFTAAQIGGNAMEIHELSGFTILALVLFRIVWGLVGSTYARFSNFTHGLAAARAYARTLRAGRPAFRAGHNPLGGWMILALLLGLLVQTGTGLFANDDVMLEGPLAKLTSKAMSDLLTKVHHVNFCVLATLIFVHVGAALYYLWVKRENLILPLISGRKRVPAGEKAEDAQGGPLWFAAVLLAICALAVWLLVR